jgi:hypothetical protein
MKNNKPLIRLRLVGRPVFNPVRRLLITNGWIRSPHVLEMEAEEGHGRQYARSLEALPQIQKRAGG